MKKMVTLMIIGLMIFSGVSVFADTTEVITAVPVLYSPAEEEVQVEGSEVIRGFVISYENQTLTLKIQDQEYSVTVYDKDNAFASDLKSIRKDDFIEVLALRGEATFYLTRINGISQRMDNAVPELISAKMIFHNEKSIEADVAMQMVDGVMMVPLRAVLEEMGYEIKWNQETYSVEILKGAQWTSIKIGENYFFKNKMAPIELSSAPVIVNDRTLVPAEFFSEILGLGIMIENGNLVFLDEEVAFHTGYVKEMTYDETGGMRITIGNYLDSNDVMDQTVIHISEAFTFINLEFETDDLIRVISPPIMTMSIPGQTSGYIIY